MLGNLAVLNYIQSHLTELILFLKASYLHFYEVPSSLKSFATGREAYIIPMFYNKVLDHAAMAISRIRHDNCQVHI